MALEQRSLQRIASVPFGDEKTQNIYVYAHGSDTLAEIVGNNGYFNDLRDLLKPGDIILCTANLNIAAAAPSGVPSTGTMWFHLPHLAGSGDGQCHRPPRQRRAGRMTGMAAPIDRAAVVNRALAGLGQPPTYTIAARTTVGDIVDHIWPQVVDRCFPLHDWPFARRTSRPVERAEEPQNGWDHAFDLVGGALGPPRRVFSHDGGYERIVRYYRIEGNILYSDEDNIWTVETVYREPDAWWPEFRTAFTQALSGYMAVPMLQDESLRDTILAATFGDIRQGGAGGLFQRVVANALAAEPKGSSLTRADPLVNARWTESWYYGDGDRPISFE